MIRRPPSSPLFPYPPLFRPPDTRYPETASSRTPLQDSCGILTPSSLHYERHHAGVPKIDPAQHRLLRSEEHTSELQSRLHLVCRLLLEKKTNVQPWLCVISS